MYNCLACTPPATAAARKQATLTQYTRSVSTYIEVLGRRRRSRRSRQLHSLACSHTINNHHMYFQTRKNAEKIHLKAKEKKKNQLRRAHTHTIRTKTNRLVCYIFY